MLKPDQIDKLEELSKGIGIRAVLMCAYTEGYTDALRESFKKITQPEDGAKRTVIEHLMDYTERVLADQEYAGISEEHPSQDN